MHKEIHKWYSKALFKDMEIAVYGNYGYALLLFPTAAADFLEYERFHLIYSIGHHIKSGKIKVFCVNTVNNECILNSKNEPGHRSIRHGQFNNYIISEVVPFIHSHCKGVVPIVTAGASVGAYHAANLFFQRPDIFSGMIAMSGVYDIKYYVRDYYDDHCYFNSPVDYLPNITDHSVLEQMRKSTIVIASGQGAYEDPESSRRLSDILNAKSVPHWLDLWGHDMRHDWPTWRAMLPYFIDKI
ncbi:MAG TPA: esterase [Ignavibacteria bacterium]|nr:esterase [Ignavibacteria bacterium]